MPALSTASAPATPAPRPAPGASPVLLHGQHASLLGRPLGPVLAAPAAALGVQAAALLPTLAPQARLAGALPFDRTAASHLQVVQAQTNPAAVQAWVQNQAEISSTSPLPVSNERQSPHTLDWSLTAEPSRAAYEASVARCVQRLRDVPASGEALHKVVLARTLLAQASQALNPWWLAQRLGADPHVLRYVAPLPVAAGDAPAWLVGATPERLLARRGRQVLSEPLAGSAPRLADASASRAQAEALQASAKDQQEHRYVVQAIADLLAPLCRQLRVPPQPTLHATATMWHLGTRIEGELRDPSPHALAQTSSLALAALLHPTPAVGGTPRAPALQALAELEPVPRGFYAGAVGWCDAHGDGDWHVSLRCARVQGARARLFAGAGIVASSSPQAEAAETRAKFNAMLHALGVRVPPLDAL
ncbi:hypothetical protein CCO03_15455 [Comamonas serinivorans]|uniref:isochorismate synthase n=1 Tax=Comamonas serinivorans TaxID=1082851 RepID=A0A1Y0EQK8_9BURK|nr:isochorismate synthase [Comamonas serinivorans]ARU05883.1 hypothetical protein CCO03_15455 [Comamonas serinivorans]